MLYKDKNGIYWKEEEVEKLSDLEVKKLGLIETSFDERYLFLR